MRLLILLLLAPCLAFAQAEPPYNPVPFGLWVEALKRDAASSGVSDAVFSDAFSTVAPNPKIIALDRKQPEGQVTLEEYLAKTVTSKRIQRGQELLAENADLLIRISTQYGVQPEFIVALWGMETSYGQNTGGFDTVEALATLAYDGRRAAFFRDELLKALTILQQDPIARGEFKGSWAGAMGQCQFMPSSFLKFAVDEDGDGRRDIWESLPDVFASIANYLHQSGWMNGEDAAEGSANYRVLMQWNRSRYFVTAVGQLAAAIRE